MVDIKQYLVCLVIWNTYRYAKSEDSIFEQTVLNNSRSEIQYRLNEPIWPKKGITSDILLPKRNRSMLDLILNPTGFGKVPNVSVTDYYPDVLKSTSVAKTLPPQHLEQNSVSLERQGRTEMSSILGKQYNEPNVQATTEWSAEQKCTLQVSKKSKIKFYNRIVYDKASAFNMNLTIMVKSTSEPGIILPSEWIWVYQETFAFLKMPRAATIWSLGLLSLYYKSSVDIIIEPRNGSESCENFTLAIGKNESDYMLGEAFGEMMIELASKDARYNTSHWCYLRRSDLTESERFLDNNFFCLKPALEYVCCSYVLDQGPEMHINCSHIFTYDSVWWDVPLGVGLLMLLYFPLLFMSVSGMVHNEIIKSSAISDDEATRSIVEVQEGEHMTPTATVKHNEMNNIVFYDGQSPVTALALLKSTVSKLIPRKQKSKSRMAIFLYSLLTLVIPGIEVLTYNRFLKEYAKSVANNNISLGFSSMIADWNTSRNCKFSILGGPYIALALYLVIGWIVTLFPTVLANQIYRGVRDSEDREKSILYIGLSKKESLGSVEIKKQRNGYVRLSRLQICHIYMLINPEYWMLAGKIVKMRFCAFATNLKLYIPFKLVRLLILSLSFPFYAVVSLTELIIAAVYFAFPMFSFLFCTTVGFSLGIDKYMSVKVTPRYPRLGSILRIPSCVFVFFILLFHLYAFTVIFLDSFFFLSRILLFTYTAIVAYPRETYGYFMLIFLSAYCGLNKFFTFGNIYELILRITIKVCNQDDVMKKYIFHKQDTDGLHGVPKSMFEYLVDRIRPRRVHILHTLIHLVSTIFILSVSIVLIQQFQKSEDISLLIHVFVTIFIFALPTIYSSVLSKKQEKTKLTRKIKKYLRLWLLNENQVNHDSQR